MSSDANPAKRINWTRSEVILACSLLAANKWKWMHPRDPRAVELSELLRLSPEHPTSSRADTFRNPNGVVRKMQDLQSRLPGYAGLPTHGSRIDREVLQEFLDHPAEMELIAERVRTAIRRGEASPVVVAEVVADFELTASEGAIIIAAHIMRERNPRLRAEKIRDALSTGSKLACEVCGFDFAEFYGDRGNEYIEVHHALPLHESGLTTTRLNDLILLCANCHRMIHRGRRWLSPAELRVIVKGR